MKWLVPSFLTKPENQSFKLVSSVFSELRMKFINSCRLYSNFVRHLMVNISCK